MNRREYLAVVAADVACICVLLLAVAGAGWLVTQ